MRSDEFYENVDTKKIFRWTSENTKEWMNEKSLNIAYRPFTASIIDKRRTKQ